MKKLILVLLVFPYFLVAQNLQTDSLDAFIAKQVRDYNIPGLAIGIIKDDQVLLQKGYGVTSTIDRFPVTTRTVFPIMSCTKAFTAAAMGILVDQGKIHWDDKVIKYLPDFKLSDPWITGELTIADILSHRSGLESYEGDLLWYGTNYSRQEIVKRIRYSVIRNNFRADYGYQNVMYLVAGMVIEKVTGLSWNNFIKENIFSPLSMQSSSTSVTQLVKEESYAQPHLRNRPISIMNMDNIAPAGSVNATIDDLLHWLQMWLGKGAYKGSKLLSEKTYEMITTQKVMLSPASDEGYGFGWNVGSSKGKKVLTHGGGLPGYKSFIMIIPEDKIGIVILTNKISYLNEELAGVIVERLNSDKMYWKDAGSGLYGKNFRFSWDEDEEATNSKQQSLIPKFSHYKGLYEDKQYGKALITEENGKAVLTLLPSKKLFSGYLYYLAKDKFKIVFNDKFVPSGHVQFKLDKDKKAVGFRLDIESSDFLFKHLNFEKR